VERDLCIVFPCDFSGSCRYSAKLLNFATAITG
jgi:hypothetical protein